MKKIIKSGVIIFLILVVGINCSFCKDTAYFEEKDPFVAGFLSATMLGLGQFYVKDYTKGSIFVLVDLVQKGMLIWMASALNDKYTNGQDDNIVKWNELTDTDQGLILGFVAFYFGSRLYSIVDAMSSAKRYNELNKMKVSQTGLQYNLSFNRASVSWNKNF
ncbi:MAG: hypothetical protein PHF84_02675 [bacterium]|nr:hypothetical protein [bacterium]